MLGLRWKATLAGAPDEGRYVTAADTLYDFAHNQLQVFPKLAEAAAAPTPALQGAVDAWLPGVVGGRVVVMVHGYQFDVGANKPGGGVALPTDDPFNRVYATPHTCLGPIAPETWHPLVGECDEDGHVLADCSIGFGWDSDYEPLGGYACLDNGFQFACLDMAPLAGRALATVLMTLENKGLSVAAIGHSLGTRTLCQALRCLADVGLTHIVQKVVLIEGSEFSVDAADAMQRLPNTDFFNIGNQDDTVPYIGALGCHPFRYNGSLQQLVIAHSGVAALPNLADLQIDRKDLQAWAAALGYVLDPGPYVLGAEKSGEHWAAYMHAGNRALIRDVLTRPDRSVAWFRDKQAPLGFSRAGYGSVTGFDVPEMPGTCQGRRDLIFPS